MSRILVEARIDPNTSAALDLIASTCRTMGHDVIRWRGRLSGKVPYERRVRPCHLAILFNGLHPKYLEALRTLRRMRALVLFVELGWYPQQGTLQVNPTGINALASWVESPLDSQGSTPATLGIGDDLLVLMQLDSDTQITKLSPWFPNMESFLEHVCRHSELPVRVRPHPLCPPCPTLVRRVERLGGSWDASGSLAESLRASRAVACINSSAGVEALAIGLPVLCYGRAIFRQTLAVYCLKDDGNETRRVTSALASGRCDLYREPQRELLDRILAHQWSFDEIPRRLPAVIETLLQAPLGISKSSVAGRVGRFADGLQNWLGLGRKSA